MAAVIKKGETFTANNPKSGTSGKGDWFMCRAKAEKGKDSITVWDNTGFDCDDGDIVKCIDIFEVKKGNRKFNDKWFDTFDVQAKLELVGKKPDAFSELSDDPDALPF